MLARLPPDHVGLPRTIAAVIAIACPDDHIGVAIAIDIPRRRNRIAKFIVCRIALDDEAGIAEAGGVNICTRRSGFSPDHVGLPSIADGDSDDVVIADGDSDDGVIAIVGPDEQIGVAIAIDIPGRRNRPAKLIIRRIALDDEAGITKIGGVDNPPIIGALGAERTRFPPNHVGLAGIVAAVIAIVGPDDQIGVAIAIDIPGRRNRPAKLITRRIALDDEAGSA